MWHLSASLLKFSKVPCIIDPTAKTVDELKKLNLPAGVDIQIKI